jgi:Tfp pilus assembly protein PilO
MTRTRKWVSGTAVLVLIVLVAGWFLLVSPKKADAANLQANVLSQQSSNAGLRVKIAQLKAEDAQRPQQEAKLALFHQQVPQTPAQPALIRQLSALAKQTGVEFEALTVVNPNGLNVPQAPAAEKDTVLEQITVTMTVQGTYFACERFINLVEGLKRVTLITGLLIKSTADTPAGTAVNPSLHRFTITARIFTTTDPAAPAAGATPTTAPSSGNASPTTVQ